MSGRLIRSRWLPLTLQMLFTSLSFYVVLLTSLDALTGKLRSSSFQAPERVPPNLEQTCLQQGLFGRRLSCAIPSLQVERCAA